MKAIVQLDNYRGIMFDNTFQAAQFLDLARVVKADGYGDNKTWMVDTDIQQFEIICLPEDSYKLPGNNDILKGKLDETERQWADDRRIKYQLQNQVNELEMQIAELKSELLDATNQPLNDDKEE